ncbi:MAG TPA: UDP-N-acetylmuramate dehydrogenase [Actinomycetes bacterium]
MRELSGVVLADYTTLRVGGSASRFVEVEKPEEAVEVVAAADRTGEPVLILGGGSNVVVPDEGFAGTVVRMATGGLHVETTSDVVAVTAQAGEDWDQLVALSVTERWSGLETMSGIPGLVGATPIQNVGAYGGEVSETITNVTVYDRRSGATRSMKPAECHFTYRSSVFKGSDRYVVLDVTYTLEASSLARPIRYDELSLALEAEVGARLPLTAVREAVLRLRRRKGMVLDGADPDTASAGSFFTNPIVALAQVADLPAGLPRWPQSDGTVKISAAWLIEHAGFGRGYGEGPARISTKHTLALTNRGGARAADLLALAGEIRDGVRRQYGIELSHEPVVVGAVL